MIHSRVKPSKLFLPLNAEPRRVCKGNSVLSSLIYNETRTVSSSARGRPLEYRGSCKLERPLNAGGARISRRERRRGEWEDSGQEFQFSDNKVCTPSGISAQTTLQAN